MLHISRPTAMPNALAMANWVMRALEGTRLDAAGKLQVHVMMHAFLQGLAVNLEAEAQAQSDTGVSEEDHMRTEEAKFSALASSGALPYFAKMMRQMPKDFVLDFDKLFALGLKVMLDGLKRVLH